MTQVCTNLQGPGRIEIFHGKIAEVIGKPIDNPNKRRKMIILFVGFAMFTSSGTHASPTQYCHHETGRCYWLGTGSVSWDAARTACQSDGGDLAVMETEELWNYVNSGILT